MIEKFLNDQQDPRAIEKVYSRLVDLLTTDEEIIYIAVQKKPVVNILSDCIALTNKRILFFTPANLGLSMKFIDFVWKDIVDVQTREEILGAVFSVKTGNGAEMGVDYLPKIQARKLYQYAQERKEAEREARRLRDLEEKRAESGSMHFDNPLATAYQPPVMAPPVQSAPAPVVQQAPEPVIQPLLPSPPPIPAPGPEPVAVVTPQPAPPVVEKPDELTEKLKKLKNLFDHGLITQEEYNNKKMELLSTF